jgi:hypothetical protein
MLFQRKNEQKSTLKIPLLMVLNKETGGAKARCNIAKKGAIFVCTHKRLYL